MNVRLYNESDLPMLKSWWKTFESHPAWEDLLPKDSTFVVEHNGIPVASMCLYLMNVPIAAMMENLIANPEVEKSLRHEAVNFLFSHIENVAKEKGYKTIVLFSYVEKLKQRYEDLGYSRTLENVTTFAKKL